MKQFTKIALMLLLILTIVACSGEAEPTVTPLPPTTNTESTEPTAVPPTAVPEPTAVATAKPVVKPTDIPTIVASKEPVATTAAAIDEHSFTNEFSSEVMGLTFQYPDDWHAEDMFGLFVFVGNIDITAAEPGEGAGYAILSFPNEDGLTLKEMFDTGLAELDIEGEQTTVISEAIELEIGGKQAIQMAVETEEAGELIRTTVTMIDNAGVFIMFSSFTQVAEVAMLQPTLDAILQSAEFSEPDLEALVGDFTTGDAVESSVGTLGTAYSEVATSGIGYTFTLSAETSYFFLANSSNGGDLTLEMLTEDGENLLSVDETFDGKAELLIFRPDTSADYTLVVREYSNLEVDFQVVGQAIDRPQTYVIDDINDGGLAIEIEPATNPRLLILMANEALDSLIDGVDAAGDGIYIDNGLVGESELLLIPANESAAYMVTIRAIDNTIGSINYAIIDLDDGIDIILSSDSSELPSESVVREATQGELGITYAVSSQGANSYSFTLSAETNYLFYVITQNDSEDIYLEIFDPSGASLHRMDDGFSGEAEKMLFTPPTTGEYALLIGEFLNAPFDFYFVGLPIEGLQTQTIGGENDEELLVEISTTETPQLLFVGATSDLDVIIEGTAQADGTEIYIDSAGAGGAESLLIPAGDGEVYMLTIHAFDNSEGSIDFILIDLDEQFVP